MNPGAFSFPRRATAITSPVDKYEAFDGGGYMTAGESIRKGDLFCAHNSESGFPIPRGLLPPGGVADAVLSAPANVATSVSDIRTVSSVGLEAGKAMFAYGRNAYNNSAAATVFSTSALSFLDSALLANGSYAIVSDGATNYPYLTILNSSGTITYGPMAIETVAMQGDIGVAGLSNGNLVVAWGVTGAVKFRTFTAAGSIVSAITTIEAVPPVTLSVCALTGGGFAVAYKSNSTNYPRIAIFDNAGASVLAATSIEAVAMGSYMSMAPLSGGGFVVFYTNGSNHPRFAIFNAAGTLQGSLTTVVATATQNVDVAGLNDGGFALVYNNSTTDLRAAAYTSGGVVRVAARAIFTGNNSGIASCAALPNDDVVVAYRNASSYTSYIKLSRNLATIEAAIACDSTYAPADVAVCPLADNRFVIAIINSTTAIYQYLNTFVGSTSYARYEGTGVINGALTSIVANPTRSISSAKVGGGGFVVGYQSLSNTPSLALFDQDAVLVGSITVPEVTYTQAVAVAALETGGYVAAWSDEFNDRIRYARYSSAGVLQGAITSGESVAPTFLSIAPLRNGGFALLYIHPTTSYPRIAIYDAAGTQTFAPANIEAVAATFVACDGLTNGNIVAFYNNGATNLRFTVISPAGASVIVPTLVETAAVSGVGGVHGCPGGEFIVAYGITAGTLLKTRRYSKFGVQQNSTITIATKSTLAVDVSTINNGDYWPVYGNATDSTVDFARYASPIAILGTALKSGGEGALIPVKVEGLVTLREDWGGVKTFDHTTATPVAGNEGSVFGRVSNFVGI